MPSTYSVRSRHSRQTALGRLCEYLNDSCPAAWLRCELTGALIVNASGSARPSAEVDSR